MAILAFGLLPLVERPTLMVNLIIKLLSKHG